MITLTTLGPVAVSVEGRDAPSELRWRKHLALLLYLARSPRGRTREQLVGLLWPDKDDAKARHSLNEALRVLRRSLAAALLTDGDRVALAPGACVADVDAPAALSTASLGRPFLEGFTVPEAPEFEDWMMAERSTVRGLQLAELTGRAERALARGQPSEARDAANAAWQLDPHHEPAARALMRAHVLEGARGLALEVFDRLTDRLDQDLGIAADPDTARLAERIRQGRIVRGAPAPAAPQPVVPLVGNARAQLESLTRAWAEGARVAVVLGDPGTGRTRLLDELLARARLDGAADPVMVDDAERVPAADLVSLVGGSARLLLASTPGAPAVDAIAERVGRDYSGVVLRTGPLTGDDVAELVAWAFPTFKPAEAARLVRRILADTAGNPFLATELVLAVKAGLELPETARPWPAVHRTLDDTLPADLAESVGAALRVRYRALTDAAQRVMAAVAVLGDGVSAETVARGADLEKRDTDAALDELEWARWVVGGERGYTVATRLAREVVLQDMVTGGQQRRIRERAGTPGSSSRAEAASPDTPRSRTGDK